MKKLLTIAVSAAAILGGSAEAKITEGFNAGVSAGIAQNKMKMKNETIFTNNKVKKQAGFNMGLRLGHTWAFSEKYFAGANLLAGYNFANVKVASSATTKLNYKPRFNFGLGLQGGMAVSESLNTYLGLNFLREQSRMEYTDLTTNAKTKDSYKVYTLTPLLGVSGSLSEKVSYFAEAGYKFSLKTSKVKKAAAATLYTKKDLKAPRGFVANVGVSYAF